jgi:phage gpG-like protein
MAIGSQDDVSALWASQKLADEIRRALGRGLEAAAIFLAQRTKELISVPAPRVRIFGQRGNVEGVKYYRAKTKATPGAPPRKLSGVLHASITWEKKADSGEIVARVGTNVEYARRLEYEGHSYLHPALTRWRDRLKEIMERAG